MGYNSITQGLFGSFPNQDDSRLGFQGLQQQRFAQAVATQGIGLAAIGASLGQALGGLGQISEVHRRCYERFSQGIRTYIETIKGFYKKAEEIRINQKLDEIFK